MAPAVFGSLGISRLLLPALLASLALGTAAHAQFQSDGYKFLEAVEERDGDAVTAALNEPGSVIVNTRDITTGETALHIVTKRRDSLWIRFLTSRGANPNARDKHGVTPIQVAASLGFIDGVEELIKAGARIDEASDTGETPLINAVHRRDVPMVRLLLESGANPDRSDNSGRTARDYAELMRGSSIIIGEFERADEARAATAEPKTYGPSF